MQRNIFTPCILHSKSTDFDVGLVIICLCLVIFASLSVLNFVIGYDDCVLHFPSFLFGRAKPPIYYFVFKFYIFFFSTVNKMREQMQVRQRERVSVGWCDTGLKRKKDKH